MGIGDWGTVGPWPAVRGLWQVVPRPHLPPSRSLSTLVFRFYSAWYGRPVTCLPDRPVREPVRPVCGSRTVRLGPARPVDEPVCSVGRPI